MIRLEELFPRILKPALGCTEPVAVALAVAAAAQASQGWVPGSETQVLTEDIQSIHIRVNVNIFKNAFAILIPNGGGHKGLPMSAALGAFCNPGLGLAIFQDVDAPRIERAEALVRAARVSVEVVEEAPAELFIEAIVHLRGADFGRAVIRHEHANLCELERNGKRVFEKTSGPVRGEDPVDDLKALRVEELVALVSDLPESVKKLLRHTMELNIAACKAGLAEPLGIGTGYYGVWGGEAGTLSTYVASMTAAGSDARMSGYPVAVMSSAGSGNQGIIATIPVVAYARMRWVDEERLLQALALSHLMTMYLTQYIGYLSALCGVAIKAGIGAACGVTYAMGGGPEEISRVIKIMAATLTGMICDGAKAGCALKVSSAAEMATRAAVLAMKKAEVPDDNGIVAESAEETIRNLALLGKAMEPVDRQILAIMQGKIGLVQT